MNPIYRFLLSAGGDTQQAFPVYKDDIAIEYALEQNQEFFRGKLSGKFVFEQNDYTFIVNRAFDTKFEFTIQISYNAGASWTQYWKGKFYKTDCEFDGDNETVSVTPSVDDAYEAVIAGLEKEFDLIQLAPAIAPVKVDKRPMVQVYVPGQTSIGCFLPGIWWEQECKAVEERDIEDYHFAKTAHKRVVLLSGNMTPTLPGHILVDESEMSGPDDLYFNTIVGNYGYACFFYGSHLRYVIYDATTNQYLWKFDFPTASGPGDPPYSVTLQPVEGSGATGTVTMNVQPDIMVYTRLVCDVNEIWGVDTKDIPVDDIVDNNRNYTKCLEYDFPDQIIFASALSATPTQWGIYQPNQYYVRPSISYYGETYPIARNTWGRISIWFAESAFSALIDQGASAPLTIRNAYPLSSVISVLLGQVAPNITHQATSAYSQFLYSSNPITGVTQTLLITPKSNVINAGYNQPAQKAPITLGQVLTMLRDCFRCYWFIDSSNRLCIEHIEYFRNGGSYNRNNPVVGTNLRKITVSRNGKSWAFAQSQYRFDKPEMAARYQFGWMDDVTELFEGFPIDIVSGYVNPDNVEEIQVNGFTSDIDYILLNPSAISQDGFVLMAAIISGGEYILPYYTYQFNDTDHRLQNAYVSFMYLQQYYAYDMPARIYKIRGETMIAVGVKRLKKQSVRFPAFNDVNLMELVKTNLGNGTIEKISINLSSRSATATLAYDTEQQF